MKPANGFTIVEVMVLITIVALVGGAFFVWQLNLPASHLSHQVTSATPTPTKSFSTPVPTARATSSPGGEWRQYVSSICGYSIAYPSLAQAVPYNGDEGCGFAVKKDVAETNYGPGYRYTSEDGYYLAISVTPDQHGKPVYDALIEDNHKYAPDEMGHWDIKTLKEFSFSNAKGYTYTAGACSDGCGYQTYVLGLQNNNLYFYLSDLHSPNQDTALRIIRSVKALQ